MRVFSLRQTNRAVLLSMSASLALTLSAQAATVKPAVTQQAATANQSSDTRLTPANSTDGIIALVNENAILKSDLVDAIVQTQARAQASGEPIANSAQLQSEVLK
jgi:peptidyl-prolyl cis-trans isomerase SurA